VLKYTYEPIAWYAIPQEIWNGKHYLNRSTDFTLSREDRDQRFNAIDPVDTGVVIVHVPSPEELTASEDVGLKTNIGQREFDTIYYDREKTNYAEYTFTPTTENESEISVRVHKPIHLREDGSQVVWGKGWSKDGDGTVTKNDDGSFTVKLLEGRNIAEVSAGPGGVVKAFHVINARGVKIIINNVTSPGKPFTVGDTAEVKLDGIQQALPKLAGIYNPGYGETSHVRYTRSDNGEYVTNPPSTQYAIRDPELNKFTVVLTTEELRLTEGVMPTGAINTTDIGGHRAMLSREEGVPPSYN
jgi:hypothetical protein